MASITHRPRWQVRISDQPESTVVFSTVRAARRRAAELAAAGHVVHLQQVDGRFRVRIRRKGFRTDSRHFDSEKAAQKWAEEQEEKLASGRDDELLPPPNPTLATLLRDHAAREVPEEERKNSPVWHRCHAIAKHPIGAVGILDLTPRHFVGFRDDRLKAKRPNAKGKLIKPTTVTKELLLLHRVLAIAIEELGLRIDNPAAAARVRRPKPHKGAQRDRRLAEGAADLPSETRVLLTGCRRRVLGYAPDGSRRQAPGNPLLLSLVRLAVETAARRGELIHLEWADVHLDKGYLRLRGEITKNGKERIVPLTLRAQRVLRVLPRAGQRVFAGMTPEAASQLFRRLCAALGLEDLRLHDLRHEATSRLFEHTSLRESEIQSITGHSDPRMLERYKHLRARYVVEAFRKSWHGGRHGRE